MKPCRKNRPRLALLASGDLSNDDVALLRRHMETCGGCRKYWREMSALSKCLSDTRNVASPEAEPSETFHARLVESISGQPRRSWLIDWLAAFWWERRAATLCALAAVAVALLVRLDPFHGHGERYSVEVARVPIRAKAPAPVSITLASYHGAAGRSLDHLDNLLAEQGVAGGPPETFKVSSVFRALEN